MKRVLNVGGFSKAIPIPDYYAGWEHVLLDIDPSQEPDICCDARELESLAGGEFNAVYCSHNLEHYWRHDLPHVLAGFVHVLRADGFADIRVPDLMAVFATVRERGLDLEDILYEAPVGPIKVNDVIYGYSREIEESGDDFFAHKNAFTVKSLTSVLVSAGFTAVYCGSGPYEIRAFAFKQAPGPDQRALFGLEG